MVLSTRLAVPVALGVSLAAVSVVVLYYVLRRDDEEETPAAGGGGGGNASVKTARMNVIEVAVPKNIVPALIGRAGSNIKDIEKKSGASIIFKKFPDRDADICLIRGRSQATQIAETLVHEFINNQPEIEEETLLVPTWACGRIIGARGDNINDISHRSGARVKIESGGASEPGSQRTVTFRGTRAQIRLARDCVERCVAQQKCLMEINESKSPRVSGGSAEVAAGGEAGAGDAPGEASPSLAKHAKCSKRPGGTSIEVYVSAVSSPARLWVQFVGPQVSQLDALVDQMTNYYNHKDNRLMHTLDEVSVGQVVAAVFRHDGRWYRARVDAIRQNEFAPTQQVADVFFLDYGDSEYVATHELCELRSDLLRLRFQAMECFLAGVRPAGREEDVVCVAPDGQRWDKWHPQAIQRFEELTKVARWKSLVSVTCTYRRSDGGGGDKDVPGIKLYDVTADGEVDIGAVLVAEGWAVETPVTPRASPAPSPRPASASTPTPAASTPATPFGDLGASRILSMMGGGDGERASSLPREHARAADLSYSDREGTPRAHDSEPTRAKHTNGTNGDFLSAERASLGSAGAAERTRADPREELKANMNRIESHHGNLESLGRGQQ